MLSFINQFFQSIKGNIPMSLQSQILIDNKWIDANNGAKFERHHPVTKQLVTQSAAAGVVDADLAAVSSHEAFKSWKRSAPSERRRLLLKAADILESKTPQFIEVMAAEVGASALWAGFNVHLAANVFREAAADVHNLTTVSRSACVLLC
jgi:salicylaldehyde dehydrogenase